MAKKSLQRSALNSTLPKKPKSSQRTKKPASGVTAKRAKEPEPVPASDPEKVWVEAGIPSEVSSPGSCQEFFHSVCKTDGDDYATFIKPWPYWSNEGWRAGQLRLQNWVRNDNLRWVPLNGTEANIGPSSVNSCHVRALVERESNSEDSRLQLGRALEPEGTPPPANQEEALLRYYGYVRRKREGESYPDGVRELEAMSDTELRELAKANGYIRVFTHNPGFESDPHDAIVDVRDFGIGIAPDDFEKTILSLGRGNKYLDLFLIGEFGQGGSNTIQYSDHVIIVSRAYGSDVVGFTVVQLQIQNGIASIRYLVDANGKIPRISAKEAGNFKHGTLIRHVGYIKSGLQGRLDSKSLYGRMRSLRAFTAMPRMVELCEGRAAKEETKGTNKGRPFYAHRHTCKGTFTDLRRAQYMGQKKARSADIIHYVSTTHNLGTQVQGIHSFELGYVTVEYFVRNPFASKKQTASDSLKGDVDTNYPIIVTLGGQNHAQLPKTYITGPKHADLWAVGPWMAVHICADGLTAVGKRALFSSSRESLKAGIVKDAIIDNLVTLFRADPRLHELNRDIDRKSSRDLPQNSGAGFAQFAKSAGLRLDKFSSTQQIEVGSDPGDIRGPSRTHRRNPPSADLVDGWLVGVPEEGGLPEVGMSPGTKYGWHFKADCPDSWWRDAWDTTGRLYVRIEAPFLGKVSGIFADGKGYVRFVCSPNATPESEGRVVLVKDGVEHPLVVKVRSKSAPSGKRGRKVGPRGREESSGSGEYRTVKSPVLPPIPLTPTENAEMWERLGWGDGTEAGMAVTSQGQVLIYYNDQDPLLISYRGRAEKAGCLDKFKNNLVHMLMMFVYGPEGIGLSGGDFLDEPRLGDEFSPDVTPRLREGLRWQMLSTFRTLVVSAFVTAKSEKELEKKVAGS